MVYDPKVSHESLQVEWVPESKGIVDTMALLVEWQASSAGVVSHETQLIEWVPGDSAEVYHQTLLIEWELPPAAYLYELTQIVEWLQAPSTKVLSLLQLVEWLQGNDIWVEPANVRIQTAETPIMAVIYDAGEGLEVKEFARYQLLDSENGSEQGPLEPNEESVDFEGNPLPPHITVPPHGTGFGAMAKYLEKDAPPVVGPDLED